MKQFTYLSLLIIAFTFFTACRQEKNRADTDRLENLDSLLSYQPKAILDSLKHINANNLDEYNKAYYNLLEVIAKDKTFYNFRSDSLINTVVDALHSYYPEQSYNYARSLMYLGIVRYRMQINDSTAYQPLKEANTIFHNLTPPDLSKQYLCLYYIAEIHSKNDNISLQRIYYKKAVQIAKHLGDTSFLYPAYSGLFWTEMQDSSFQIASHYIDTLSHYVLNDNEYIISFKNIQSVYFQYTGKQQNALTLEKEILALKDLANMDTAISNYYNISQIYRDINSPDSALKYAKLTIMAIQDTCFRLNYRYYLNLASIAEGMKEWQLSAAGYKKTYELLERDVDKNSDTKIFELEKKYDLAESENKRLVTENRLYSLLGISAILLLILIIVIFYYHQYHLKMMTSQQIKDEQLKNQQLILDRDIAEKQWVTKLYNYVSRQRNEIGKLLYKLQNNILIIDNEKVSRLIDETEKIYKTDIKKLSLELLDNKMLVRFTNLTSSDIEKLSESDKFILMLMACEMNDKQIANLLNSSYDSIRIRKKRLLNKMIENNINIPSDIRTKNESS